MRAKVLVLMALVLLMALGAGGNAHAAKGSQQPKAPTFTYTPSQVEPGGTVQVTSVTPCPSATDLVRLNLGPRRAEEPSVRLDMPLPGGGQWTASLAVAQTMPDGRYVLMAACIEAIDDVNPTCENVLLEYKSQSVVVRSASR